MQISYFVLYCSDPAASAAWYTNALALRFTTGRHGGGHIHYSTALDGGTVLELYPTGDRPTSRTRIGITVRDPYGVGPEPSTITDPDGNTIEVMVRAGQG